MAPRSDMSGEDHKVVAGDTVHFTVHSAVKIMPIVCGHRIHAAEGA
jgi:hypothetical protein